MSLERENTANEVRPIMDGIVTSKNYIDIVGIPNKDETIRRIDAVSNGSVLTWEFQNITCNTFLDRKVALEFDKSYIFTGAGGRAFTAGSQNSTLTKIALRYSPVLSTASNIEVAINNQKISYPLSRFYEPVSRFNGGDRQETIRISNSPVQHDYSSYFSGVEPPALGQGGLNNIVTYSPFNYGIEDFPGRSQIIPYSIVNGAGNNDSIVSYRWTEYLDLSPLTSWAKSAGFYNISSISISISLPTNLVKYLSFSYPECIAINGDLTAFCDPTDPINVAFAPAGGSSSAQKMRLHTITAPFEKPRPLCILPAQNISIISSGAVGPIANNGTLAGVLTNNISLAKVPSKIYLFANRFQDIINPWDANTYALITGLKMQYGNRSDYFNGYTTYDLYNQFVYQKGFKVPYDIYERFTGSVLCIEPSDIFGSLPAGSSCCTNLNFQVDIKNILNSYTYANQAYAPADTTFQLMVVLVYDAVMSYTRTTFNINDIVIDASEVIEKARFEYNNVPENILLPACRLGGGIKDDFMSALSTVVGGAQSAYTFYMQNKSWIDPLLNEAKDLGMSAIDVVASLFAAGLTPNEIYERASLVYPQPELNKVFKSLKSAGCCGCDQLGLKYEQNPMSFSQDYYQPNVAVGGKVKSKVSKKKPKRAGVIITEEADFNEMPKRKSLLDRY